MFEHVKEQVAIRYGKELYVLAEKNATYHFLYAYKRFSIEIVKSIYFLCRILKNGSVPLKRGSLALYNTDNQKKALESVYMMVTGGLSSKPIDLYCFSITFVWLRLISWICAVFCYPFYFLCCKNRPALYDIICIKIKIYAMNKLISLLISKGVKEVFISNDHCGDIFLLSILLRDIESIKVVYAQHGSAKKEFPENYFHRIIVYDTLYKSIYEKLSMNPSVKIDVIERLGRKENTYEELESLDILICLSHQFRVLNLLKLVSMIKRKNIRKVAVRFHPSDNLARYKLAILRMMHPIELSSSSISFEQDFGRASTILCASSSLLLDAYNLKITENMYWLKGLGLEWDYYKLQHKINVIDDMLQLNNILKAEEA